MLEKTFQAQALKRLNAQATGQGVWIIHPRTRFGKSGVADIVLASAAVELKAPGSRYGITPAQQGFLDKLEAAGGIGGLVTSHEELEEYIHDWNRRAHRLLDAVHTPA